LNTSSRLNAFQILKLVGAHLRKHIKENICHDNQPTTPKNND